MHSFFQEKEPYHLDKKEVLEQKAGLEEKVAVEQKEKVKLEKKEALGQKKVLEEISKMEPEKVVEKTDDDLSARLAKVDALQVGISVALLYAYLEYANAKDASNKMKAEESQMNTASTYADARYHQGKAEGYSEQVDYHYQNTTNGVVIAAGLFAWKVWKSINRTEVPNISFYPPTVNNDTATLSWNYRF